MNELGNFLGIVAGSALLLATPSGRILFVRRGGERPSRNPKETKMTATKMTPAARKARNSRLTAQSTFGLGLVVSIAANVTVSEHTAVGFVTAVWAPVALLLALALLENGSISGRAAKVAVGALALVAAWASYWHLVEFFTAGGADAITAHSLPLTVDVLMGLASAGMKRKPVAATRKPVARKAPAKKAATSPAKLTAVAS